MPIEVGTISALGVIIGLVGVVWAMLNSRIAAIEKMVGKQRDVFNEKTPMIFASAARLEELERRMGRLEETLTRWMERVEEKIDKLRQN